MYNDSLDLSYSLNVLNVLSLILKRSSRCIRFMVSSRPSQNKKKKANAKKTNEKTDV